MSGEDTSKLEEIRQYSYEIDNNPEYEGLPYQRAYEKLTGDDSNDPIWKRIDEDGRIGSNDESWFSEIIEKYPLEEMQEIKDRMDRSQTLAQLMSEVNLWKGDWRFVKGLINQVIDDGKPLSDKQLHWMEHYIFKYREQLMDAVVYEKTASEDTLEVLGEKSRQSLEQIIEECEQSYEKDPNYKNDAN